MESRFKEKTTEEKRKGIRRVTNELNEKEKKNLPSGKALVTFAKRRDQIAKEHVGFFMVIDSQAQLRVQRLQLNL